MTCFDCAKQIDGCAACISNIPDAPPNAVCVTPICADCWDAE